MNSRNLLGKMVDFAGSRNFSVFVSVMGITYVLVLAVFALFVENRWLVVISGLLPYKLLYALFFVNLILLEIKWIPAVVRRCRKTGSPESAEKLARFGQAIPVAAPGSVAGIKVGELVRYLKRRGYRVSDGSDGYILSDNLFGNSRGTTLLYACRGRFSPLGDLLFHAGFLLILFGAVTNVLSRFEGTAIVAEGESFTGSKKEYRIIAGASAAALPEVDFDAEKISAEFWDGKLFFTRLEAQLLHRGGRDIASLSSAATIGSAAVTIAGYGYVPRFEFKNKEGKLEDYNWVKLNIFSPGSEDYFYVPEYPHKIFVSFYPDYAEVDGKAVNRSMNPLNPAYALRIFRGRVPVYSGVIKQGEWAAYDGLSISFSSLSRSGDFKIVRNPGHPFIWAAFILMGIGLVWRLLYYRKELALWQDETGNTWLSGHGDYYPRLHAEWLAGLAEKFKGQSQGNPNAVHLTVRG